jgi:iron complex transport system substrate-binding protein
VVLDYPDDLGAPSAKFRAVGRLLGVSDRAEPLAARVASEIEAATRAGSAASGRPKVAVLYLRGEGARLLLTSPRPLAEAARGVDVSAGLGLTASAPADPEALIAAAPDVLLVTTSGLESVGGVDGLLALEQGALARTPSGRQRRVIAFDDQYLLGFGPRTGALLTELVAALHPIA